MREHHPSRLKKLEQEHREFEYQQIQNRVWLGEDLSAFRQIVEDWLRPLAYLKQYEWHGYPILRHETAAFICRALLGLPVDTLAPDHITFLVSRRRSNSSYNNTAAADGGDGHVLSTWWGLQALHTLGRAEEREGETTAWLRACQRPDGGFLLAAQRALCRP